MSGTDDDHRGRSWTFMTNHARVLIHITRNPNTRVRDIADSIGITERAAQNIVNDLEEAEYITRTRIGRRNHYTIDADRPFRHPDDADQRVLSLLALFTSPDRTPGIAGPRAGPGGSAGPGRGSYGRDVPGVAKTIRPQVWPWPEHSVVAHS